MIAMIAGTVVKKMGIFSDRNCAQDSGSGAAKFCKTAALLGSIFDLQLFHDPWDPLGNQTISNWKFACENGGSFVCENHL